MAIVLVAWALIANSGTPDEQQRVAAADTSFAGPPNAVGTSGRLPTTSPAHGVANPDETARALQQLTGAKSEAELIGKHIEVEALPQQVNNGVAFWADTHKGGQVLVVLSRDQRTEAQRYWSQVAPRDDSAQPGQPVKISGTIQKVPAPEQRYSWGEFDPAHRTTFTARVYLKADSIAASSPQP